MVSPHCIRPLTSVARLWYSHSPDSDLQPIARTASDNDHAVVHLQSLLTVKHQSLRLFAIQNRSSPPCGVGIVVRRALFLELSSVKQEGEHRPHEHMNMAVDDVLETTPSHSPLLPSFGTDVHPFSAFKDG